MDSVCISTHPCKIKILNECVTYEILVRLFTQHPSILLKLETVYSLITGEQQPQSLKDYQIIYISRFWKNSDFVLLNIYDEQNKCTKTQKYLTFKQILESVQQHPNTINLYGEFIIDEVILQCPEIFTYIIDYITLCCVTDNVNYIELSVKVDYLCNSQIYNQLVEECNGVKIKYLAMISRHVNIDGMKANDADAYIGSNKCHRPKINNLFKTQICELEKLKELLENNKENLIIGLDYECDKKINGYEPYCPFHLPSFLDFLKTQNKTKLFKLRINIAKVLPAKFEELENYVAIIMYTVLKIFKFYGKMNWNNSCDLLRIGNVDKLYNLVGIVTDDVLENAFKLLIEQKVIIECNSTNYEHVKIENLNAILVD